MGWAGIKKPLFGEYLEVVIHAENKKKAHTILKKAYKEALRLQKIFNFYDNQSEINKLNKKRTLKASPELLMITKQALQLCKETQGLYDISLGRNFLRRKSHDPIIPLSCTYKDIHITKDLITLQHKDALLDLGSIAKGHIADAIGILLKKEGITNYVIDARGDILVSGEGTPIIRVQHPREQGSIMTLQPKNKGVATSGDYQQYDENFDNSHIINQNNNISVTVIAPTLAEADLYATVFSVIPETMMKKLLQKHKHLAVLTINKQLVKNYYNNFKKVAQHE